MSQKIDRDHQRFRKLVHGKIKSDLKKYISRGELIGKKGKDLISIPLPQIIPPQFRFGDKGSGGVGQGNGQPGTPLGPGNDPADGSSAGDQPGGHILEVDVTMAEMAQILGEELALPRIEPRGKKNIISTRDKYTGIRQVGPESLRHFKRTYKRAIKRMIASGSYDPKDPIVIPIRQDKQYRSWRETQQPQSVAVIINMMDVSGSMSDEQKEIVRIEAFWINTWIKSHYQGVENVFIIHDVVAREVDEHTFFHTRESGGTRISSAYNLAEQLISTRYPPDCWNIYLFHFSDGDNMSDDIPVCLDLLKEKILPKVNLFGYGQVESSYRGGEFYDHLVDGLGHQDNVICSRIPNRDAILPSIKEFLGTGR